MWMFSIARILLRSRMDQGIITHPRFTRGFFNASIALYDRIGIQLIFNIDILLIRVHNSRHTETHRRP
jgi:hypothetical protein